MNGSVLQLTLREWLDVLMRPRLLATFAIIVALFTFTGPFGTITRLSPSERFIYWLLVLGFSWATGIGCAILSANLLHDRLASLLTRIVIGSLLGSVFIAFEVMLLEWAIADGGMSFEAYGHDLLISIPLCLLFSILTYIALGMQEPRDPAASPQATDGGPGAFPLARRLKPENRGRLIRLTAEDHYTDVVTEAGRELILIRFSDALAELGSQSGLQVHRSHWVADAGVVELNSAAGRMMILLKDGSEIPVSRANQADVRSRFGAKAAAAGKRSTAD